MKPEPARTRPLAVRSRTITRRQSAHEMTATRFSQGGLRQRPICQTPGIEDAKHGALARQSMAVPISHPSSRFVAPGRGMKLCSSTRWSSPWRNASTAPVFRLMEITVSR